MDYLAPYFFFNLISCRRLIYKVIAHSSLVIAEENTLSKTFTRFNSLLLKLNSSCLIGDIITVPLNHDIIIVPRQFLNQCLTFS